MTWRYFPRDITLEEAIQVAMYDWQPWTLPGIKLSEVIARQQPEVRRCGWLFKNLPLRDYFNPVPTEVNFIYITKRGGSYQLMNPDTTSLGREALDKIEARFGQGHYGCRAEETLMLIGIQP